MSIDRPPTIRNLVSAGGVIFQVVNEVVQVALVTARERNIWCLPKGVIEKGEKQEETSLREVQEETGLAGEILERIGHISYWYYMSEKTVRVHKTVHYFLMRYLSGHTDDHDNEVDDARWFPVDEAANLLKYKGEKFIMQKARNRINKILTGAKTSGDS